MAFPVSLVLIGADTFYRAASIEQLWAQAAANIT